MSDPDRELVRMFQLIVRANERIDRAKRIFSPVVRSTVYPQIAEIESSVVREETTPFAVVIETDGYTEPGKKGLLEYHPAGTTSVTAFSDESLENVLWTRKLDAVIGKYYPSPNEYEAGALPVPFQPLRLDPKESKLYLPTKEGEVIQLNYLNGEVMSEES